MRKNGSTLHWYPPVNAPTDCIQNYVITVNGKSISTEDSSTSISIDHLNLNDCDTHSITVTPCTAVSGPVSNSTSDPHELEGPTPGMPYMSQQIFSAVKVKIVSKKL